MLDRDQPLTVVYHQPWIFAMASKIDGFKPYPDGIIRVTDMKFK